VPGPAPLNTPVVDEVLWDVDTTKNSKLQPGHADDVETFATEREQNKAVMTSLKDKLELTEDKLESTEVKLDITENKLDVSEASNRFLTCTIVDQIEARRSDLGLSPIGALPYNAAVHGDESDSPRGRPEQEAEWLQKELPIDVRDRLWDDNVTDGLDYRVLIVQSQTNSTKRVEYQSVDCLQRRSRGPIVYLTNRGIWIRLLILMMIFIIALTMFATVALTTKSWTIYQQEEATTATIWRQQIFSKVSVKHCSGNLSMTKSLKV